MIKDQGLGFTRQVLLANDFPQTVLETDVNRKDLSIFNLSETDTVYIALGVTDHPQLLVSGKYPKELAIPLFPGEGWEPSVIPYNDIVMFLDEFTINSLVTVAYTTLLPELVKGEASPDA